LASLPRSVPLGLLRPSCGPVLPHPLGHGPALLLGHRALAPPDRLDRLLPAAPGGRRGGSFDRLDGALDGDELALERAFLAAQRVQNSAARHRDLLPPGRPAAASRRPQKCTNVGRRRDRRGRYRPIASFGDVLCSAPGVNVIQLSARDVQVTSRQSTGTVTNSQLVLVDGRSTYLDFGLVMWDLLPANQGDIEQFEVVRGPASATWGANAMTGAVNIITRPPRQSVGTTVTMSGGWIDRDAGSTAGQDAGTMFGTNATVTRAPTDRLAYRISAGYFRSAADGPDSGHRRPAGAGSHGRRRTISRGPRRRVRRRIRQPRHEPDEVRRAGGPGAVDESRSDQATVPLRLRATPLRSDQPAPLSVPSPISSRLRIRRAEALTSARPVSFSSCLCAPVTLVGSRERRVKRNGEGKLPIRAWPRKPEEHLPPRVPVWPRMPSHTSLPYRR